MDANDKSKYSHWKSKSTTNATNTTHNTKPHQKFNYRYKYSVDLTRLLQDGKNKKSLSATSQTSSSNTIIPTNTNITTRYQQNNTRTKTSVPLTKRMQSNIDHKRHNTNNITKDIKDNTNNTNIAEKLQNFKYNKYMLSSKSNNLLINANTKINNNNNTQYNLSLIRPSDRVVLYSPVATCYVCLSDFEDDDTDGKEENDSDALYLKCDDMEGVALLIGETQFCGTCKFLADCKIQLITGQGLYKDRDRIIIHSKHTTKFMLQKYDNLGDTGSMAIGHKVLIFVEASRSNRKQFWSYDSETECIVLKEIEPTQNEIFILQKYGQPLQLEAYKDNENDKDIYNDGYIMDNFFGDLNINIEERYLCYDILRVLARDSFNGDFIEFSHDKVYGFPRIILNGAKYGISPLLSSAMDGLKVLIEDTAIVRYFISIHCRSEYGVVSQAFCAEIDKDLADFNLLLVQLETRLNRGELTLQNMRFYLQRASRSMNGLRRICCDIHLNKERKTQNKESKTIYYGSRGGGLLNMIQKHIDLCGQKHIRILYNKLFLSSQKPYFNMLSNWIYRGVITDIYNEFMIKEKTHLKKEDLCIEYNNEYWTGRYSLNHVQIPLILYDYMDIIVTTGKYLNVMRESGYHDIMNELKTLNQCNSRELGEYINDQYNFASKALLEMLMNRERIMDRFNSIGKYMLLQCGDWFCYFMDMAQSILFKNAADIKKTKLDRLLELSFRTSNSSIKNDPFKDDVCCDIKNCNLNKMMVMLNEIRSGIDSKPSAKMTLNGIESFALNYNVEWPASIIFTGRNLIRYQLIFRFLFKLKYVSRQLKAAWKQQMSLRELNLYDTHNSSLMLRHKMLSFCDNLLFYISYQVIEPNWNKFIQNTLNTIKTVDSLLSAQETFLTQTLKQCLFTNKETIQLLFKILICCDGYSNFIKRYTKDWKIHQIKYNNNKQRNTAIHLLAKDCRDNLLSTNFTNSIKKYSKSFEDQVRSFLNNLQKTNDENININVLLLRLDYNAYYIPTLVEY